MTATYVALDVPTTTAITGVLAYRLIAHWLPIFGTGPMLLASSSWQSRKARP